MPIQLNFDFKDEILFTYVKGTFSLDSAKSNFHEVIDKFIEYKAKLILIDCRHIQNTNLIENIFEYSKYISEQLLDKVLKNMIYTPILLIYSQIKINLFLNLEKM